ncbi:MAG: hypothetical protein O7H41_15855 [Planctomycetota bacterium]|nr:hypothetical protein [Planctomycetota bacterium]
MSRASSKACLVIVIGLLAAPGACGAEKSAAIAGETEGVPAYEAIVRTTTVGPVTANVTLAPAAPTLGDPIRLVLEVTAEAHVEVQMPAFGEALGRFEIVDFTPRRRTTPDGRTTAIQEYTLETPMSGPQVLPPLRVEFRDRRSSRPGDADPDEIHELLTEKVSFEVASVLTGGAVSEELRPARGRLSPLAPPPPDRWPWALAVGIALAVSTPLAVLAIRRWIRHRRRRTAFDVAIARIASLDARGAPSPEESDAWYVELSGIVRRYLEDRYALRAPERTTEEFLREAGRFRGLRQEHRTLLRVFLQGCDRVKFAAYLPREDESREAMQKARSFLEETREGAPLLVEV